MIPKNAVKNTLMGLGGAGLVLGATYAINELVSNGLPTPELGDLSIDNLVERYGKRVFVDPAESNHEVEMFAAATAGLAGGAKLPAGYSMLACMIVPFFKFGTRALSDIDIVSNPNQGLTFLLAAPIVASAYGITRGFRALADIRKAPTTP